MSQEPTGQQVNLRLSSTSVEKASSDETFGKVEVTACIAQVGASLRALTVEGIDLIVPYPSGLSTPSSSGQVLVPWPNRLRDGRWRHDGEALQLPINEPARHNAIHGLLTSRPYDISVAANGADATLRADIRPSAGYPFALCTEVIYQLVANGLRVTHQLTNAGDDSAPVALGTHPYICLGETAADHLVLTSPGASMIEVDDRLLPVRTVPVGQRFDLRNGRVLSQLDLDTGYADLIRDPDGLIRHHLTDRQGHRVTLWQDERFAWAQIYTTTTYPNRPLALAVEPMTAPADAFNSGQGLVWLSPGESFTASWGIELTRVPSPEGATANATANATTNATAVGPSGRPLNPPGTVADHL